MRHVTSLLLAACIVLALTTSAQARCGILGTVFGGVRDRVASRIEYRQERRQGWREGTTKTVYTSGNCAGGNCNSFRLFPLFRQ